MPSLQSLKTVIRSRDVDASRAFYAGVLGLEIVESWDQDEGRGFIVAVGDGAGTIEAAEAPPGSTGDDPVYDTPANDKIDIQIKTAALDEWAAALRGKWEFEGPVERPWGHRYIFMRDPDNVRVALFEGTN